MQYIVALFLIIINIIISSKILMILHWNVQQCSDAVNTATSTVQKKHMRQHTGELDLKECFGERLTVLRRGALFKGGVLRNDSMRGVGPAISPDTAGSTATAPGRALANFFLLEGGMREAGMVVGTGSFSMARYTRCMA